MTENAGTYRFDIVGNDQVSVDRRLATLEAAVRAETDGQRVRFGWSKSSHVPVPFR